MGSPPVVGSPEVGAVDAQGQRVDLGVCRRLVLPPPLQLPPAGLRVSVRVSVELLLELGDYLLCEGEAGARSVCAIRAVKGRVSAMRGV